MCIDSMLGKVPTQFSQMVGENDDLLYGTK